MNQKIKYTDEPIKLGKRLADFLPPPAQLVRKEATVKITLELNRHSLEVMRAHAKRQNVPYQRMLRQLVDEYALKYPGD